MIIPIVKTVEMKITSAECVLILELSRARDSVGNTVRNISTIAINFICAQYNLNLNDASKMHKVILDGGAIEEEE
jgi:hypothetical protein